MTHSTPARSKFFSGPEVLTLVLPALWIGLTVAISFIEAPLKFQAPGITIPLGLGIGRLVFLALNIAEGVVLLALLAAALIPARTRAAGLQLWSLLLLAGMYLAKVFVVRPPLNARTAEVLAGADPGGSSVWHYIYIAADMTQLVLLVVLICAAVSAIRRRYSANTEGISINTQA